MIQALLPQLLPILGSALDEVLPDTKAKDKALSKMKTALIANQSSLGLETIKTNQVEAAHRSIWVAGWRPAIGWSLAIGIFWMLVGFPLAVWVSELYGLDAPLPRLPVDILFELTLAMLGMSGIRSFDKFKNLTK